MITKYVDVDDGKWGIVMVYDYDMTERDRLGAIMDSFGLKYQDIKKALRILEEPNTGMAISRDDVRMSAIFISNTTEDSEFYSTLAHELAHVKSAIVDYYQEDYRGEPYAYLSGYLMKRAIEEIGQYPCE